MNSRDVIVDSSVLVQWETLANEALADAREWKARAYAAEAALRKLASRLNTSVTLDSATQRAMRDEVNAAIAKAEGK